MDQFQVKTKILTGVTSLNKLLCGANRVFVITDKFMVESNKIDVVIQNISKSIECEVYSDIAPDPDVAMVTEGVKHLIQFNPEWIITFGGGSAIDCAKAMLFFAQKEGSISAKPEFIAIPTTSGTGSEVTKFAVITDSTQGVKYPLVDESLLPDYAILDGSLTCSMPASITADTGLDVLTHGVEAYLSTQATSFSDMFAEKSVKLVWENLLFAYKNPTNLQAREQLHYGSCMAGIAFSHVGLGLCHAMAHILGARTHLPHGRVNAMLLPHVIWYNADFKNNEYVQNQQRYAELASLLGHGGSTKRQSALNFHRMVEKRIKELNIPLTLTKAGIDIAPLLPQIEEMAEISLQDACLKTNPRQPTAQDVVEIYKKLLV